MRIWLKNPLAILADDAAGGLVVEKSQILEIVPRGTKPQNSYDQVFDASDHVILPGLINTHHHFYQTLTRACPSAINKELFPWLKALYPIWAGLNPENFRLAVRVALAELLLSGCTTAADHHYVYPEKLTDGLDIQVEEAKALGMRIHLTRGSMNLSVADGGLPPQSVVQDKDTILADSESMVNKYHQHQEGAFIQVALAPCSPFSVTTDIMLETAELAEKLNVRLHTHLAETEDENQFCLSKFGCRPVDYLENVGWMSDRTWLAHGIHFSDDEIQRLGQAGVAVAHCPSSNHILASGPCPVPALEAAGVPVGLAVDGSASQDCSNLIQEIRQAFFLQRLGHGAANITHFDAYRWATAGSAACLGRKDIGEIAVGKQADLAMFKLDELRFSGAGDPLAALILCGAHRADRVMVGGKWAVVDGAIPGLDIADLIRNHHSQALTLQGIA
ncbi:MAG: 8-oxoguanine deaminase [Alphaproteobacteria bacterium]|nr:8-oxoguanine deaminase [Alphaproteobacteria bacterium]